MAEASALKKVSVSIGKYKEEKEKVVILELLEEDGVKTFLTMEPEMAEAFADTVKEAAQEIIGSRELQ